MMRKIIGVGIGVCLLIALTMLGQLFEQVNANEVVVIQSVSGQLTINATPGIKWQGFGKVTSYAKRGIYEFDTKVRFNDGAHAQMKGSIQYEVPLNDVQVKDLHTRFGSQEAVQTQLVQTVVDKSVYMTGPLMSSKESYAERRNDLIWFVENQVEDGVYKTTQREVHEADPVTGQDKWVTRVELVKGKDGLPERQESGVLRGFGIKTFNFSLKSLDYDEAVEKQITAQQQATMDVQTAMAESKKAEQRALTAEKEGQATAAKARWEQESIKAKAVVQAQQEKEVAVLAANRQLEVAQLGTQEAEQYRLAVLARAEADSTYKKKVMDADGALKDKLASWQAVNALYAAALGAHQGPLVPCVVLGGGSGTPGQQSSVNDLMSLLMAKTARDVGLDLSMRGKQ
mgnify:FL=1